MGEWDSGSKWRIYVEGGAPSNAACANGWMAESPYCPHYHSSTFNASTTTEQVAFDIQSYDCTTLAATPGGPLRVVCLVGVCVASWWLCY